jgi:hypothetical protein
MVCTSCGATIADKAIICYRCGHPTASPEARQARAPKPRRTWMVVAVIVVVLAAGVLVRACSLV